MSDQFKNIDDLFREGLNNDSPVFKDEFWQNFEHSFQNMPQQTQSSGHSSSSSSGSGSGSHSLSSSGSGSLSQPLSSSISGVSSTVTTGVTTGAGSSAIGGMVASGIIVKSIIAISTVAVISTSTFFGVKYLNESNSPAENIASSTDSAFIVSSGRQVDEITDTANPFVSSVQNNVLNIITEKDNNISYISVKPAGPDNNAISGIMPAITTETLKNLKDNQSGINSHDNTNDISETYQKQSALDFVNNKESVKTSSFDKTLAAGAIPDATGNIQLKNEIANSSETLPDTDNDAASAVSDSVKSILSTAQDDVTKNINQTPSPSPAGPPPVKIKTSPFSLYLSTGALLYKTFGNTAGFSEETKPALHISAGIEYDINQHLSVYLEPGAERINGLELDQSSFKGYSFFNSYYKLTTTVQNRELNLFSIPVFLRYKLNRNAFAAGPAFLYVISSKGEIEKSERSSSGIIFSHEQAENYLSGFVRLQYGASLEYSYNVFRQNAILIRYTYYFTNINKSSGFTGLSDAKLNNLLIGLRIKIY